MILFYLLVGSLALFAALLLALCELQGIFPFSGLRQFPHMYTPISVQLKTGGESNADLQSALSVQLSFCPESSTYFDFLTFPTLSL